MQKVSTKLHEIYNNRRNPNTITFVKVLIYAGLISAACLSLANRHHKLSDAQDHNEAFDEKYTALNLTFSRQMSGTYFVLPSYCDFYGNETQYCEEDANNTKHIADLTSKETVVITMLLAVVLLPFLENMLLRSSPRAVTFASAVQRLSNAVMLSLPFILLASGGAALWSMGQYGVPVYCHPSCSLLDCHQ